MAKVSKADLARLNGAIAAIVGAQDALSMTTSELLGDPWAADVLSGLARVRGMIDEKIEEVK